MTPLARRSIELFRHRIFNPIDRAILTPLMRYKLRRELPVMMRTRQILAGIETVAYVDEHLREAKALTTGTEILRHALSLAPQEGLYLEFGVASGTTINIIASLTKAIVHGFDSFEGLPEDWWGVYKKGTFASPGRRPKTRKNVTLHVGWFNDTLPRFLETHREPVAFLHIDCDVYSSAKTVLDHLRDRIRPGCVIVLDEYFNYPGWRQGEYKAFHEFLAETGLHYHYLAYNECGEGVAVIITEEV